MHAQIGDPLASCPMWPERGHSWSSNSIGQQVPHFVILTHVPYNVPQGMLPLPQRLHMVTPYMATPYRAGHPWQL